MGTFKPRGHLQVKLDANRRTRAYWAFWRDRLHDAAGNSSPANAAHVTLRVTPETSHGGSGGSGNSSGKGSEGSNSSGNGSISPKSQLHIVATVRRHKLTIRVTGPSNGVVRVHYTAKYRRKMISTHSKTTNLRHGKLTVTLRSPPALLFTPQSG